MSQRAEQKRIMHIEKKKKERKEITLCKYTVNEAATL